VIINKVYVEYTDCLTYPTSQAVGDQLLLLLSVASSSIGHPS
jgi:hypothetical protein